MLCRLSLAIAVAAASVGLAQAAEAPLSSKTDLVTVYQEAAKNNADIAAARAPDIGAAGIQGIIPVLVQGHGQHIRVVQKDRLGAVAVVDIPIDHRETPGQTCGARGLNGDGDIGQQAKSIGHVGQTMMPGRARQRIGIGQIAAQDQRDGSGGKARRQRRDLVSALQKWGVMADLAAGRIRQRLEPVKIAGGVDAQQIFARGGVGRLQRQFAHQAGHMQQVDQPALAFRAFRQPAAGLDMVTHGQGQRIIAAAVPQGQLIMEKSGHH